MINYLKNRRNRIRFKRIWRKRNTANNTIAGNIFDVNKVHVGKGTYGVLNILSWGSDQEFLEIGNYCSIATDVKFLLGGNHNYKKLFTYAFRYFYAGEKAPGLSKGPIVINDGVWIGHDVTILSGVTIGKGAVIGAASVVSKNIPDYGIAVGNPIRVVNYRFSDDIIKRLNKIDFYNMMNEILYKYNRELFESEVDHQLLDKLEDKLKNHV